MFSSKVSANMKRNTIDPQLMRDAAAQATALLRALAHEDRLLLLCELSQGEQSVSELEELMDLHQPSLSQQLGVLRNEGLVNTRRDGKRIYYAIESPAVLRVLKTLYDIYCPKK
jgi:DNA-binding transcriptional ArsR family regulator